MDDRTESEAQDIPPDIQSEIDAGSLLTIAVCLQSFRVNVVLEARTNSRAIDD